MKRFWIIIIIIGAILLLLGFLYDQGYLRNLEWQGLTMILAALSGPFAFFRKKFSEMGGGGTQQRIEESTQRYEAVKTAEQEKIVEYDKIIAERQRKLDELKQEEQKLNQDLQNVRSEYEIIDNKVDNMSLDETRVALGQAFG